MSQITGTNRNSKESIQTPVQVAQDEFPNCPPECKKKGQCVPPANGISFAESKRASEIAYIGNKGDIYRFPDGKEWEVTDNIGEINDGFRSVTLQPVDKSDDRVILAFAGSGFPPQDDPQDWWTNAKQGFPEMPAIPPFNLFPRRSIPDDYLKAAETAIKLKEQYKDRLILTGHSLGGGEVSFASAMSGCTPSTAINAAPLNNMTLEVAKLTECKKNTQHYNVPFEFLPEGSKPFEPLISLSGDPVHLLPGEQLGNGNPIAIPGTGHGLEVSAPCVAALSDKDLVKEGPKTTQNRLEKENLALEKEILAMAAKENLELYERSIRQNQNQEVEIEDEEAVREEENRSENLDRKLQEEWNQYHKEFGLPDQPSPQILPRPKK